MNEISAFRKIASDFLRQRNTIDRLMTDKVDDYILIEEHPLPIMIGDRTIFIGNFTIMNETEFFQKWGNLLSLLAARICNWELSTEKKKELLEKCDFKMLAQSDWMIEFIYRDRWFWKNQIALIGKMILKQQSYYLATRVQKKIKWKNCSFRYFRKHITKEKLLQICFLIYFYNFDSVKKNLRLILEKMNLIQLSETYIPFWLQNCPGLTGKFVTQQVASPVSVFDDSQSEIRPPSTPKENLKTPEKSDA